MDDRSWRRVTRTSRPPRSREDGTSSAEREEAPDRARAAPDELVRRGEERESEAPADGEGRRGAHADESKARPRRAEDEERAAAQLGIQRYVLAGFFAAGIAAAPTCSARRSTASGRAPGEQGLVQPDALRRSLAAVTDEQKTDVRRRSSARSSRWSSWSATYPQRRAPQGLGGRGRGRAQQGEVADAERGDQFDVRRHRGEHRGDALPGAPRSTSGHSSPTSSTATGS